MTSIPEGWTQTALRHLLQPTKQKAEPSDLDASSPYVGLEHIETNSGRLISKGLAREVSSTKSRFKAGDVLYGKLRPYLNKVFLAPFDGICSTDILVFPRSPALEPDYLAHFLRQPSVVSFANHNSSGIQLPRVSFSTLGQLPVPLPPLAEQHRIVAKLEDLLDRVDAARERLRRLPTILRRFRQSVLAAACSGRLTQDWREAHGNGDWQYSPLREWNLSVRIGPFGTLLHREDYVKGGVPLVNPTHIKDGEIRISPDCTVRPTKAQDLSAYRLRRGDVVLARRGQMGRAAIVSQEADGFLCGTGSLFIRPDPADLLPAAPQPAERLFSRRELSRFHDDQPEPTGSRLSTAASRNA
jgi:type I restriction enzyme, S subunit